MLERDDTTGFNYVPGLQIVPSLVENQGEHDWRFDGLCHEQYDVFDLESQDNLTQTPRQQADNQYRAAAARRICFECPVFEQCHDDALEHLPQGVVQAGARLSSPFAKQREITLLKTHIRWQQYKARRQT